MIICYLYYYIVSVISLVLLIKLIVDIMFW